MTAVKIAVTSCTFVGNTATSCVHESLDSYFLYIDAPPLTFALVCVPPIDSGDNVHVLHTSLNTCSNNKVWIRVDALVLDGLSGRNFALVPKAQDSDTRIILIAMKGTWTIRLYLK